MKKTALMILMFFWIVTGSAFSQALPDLTFENFSIEPVPTGINSPRIQLHMYRSYRVTAAIKNVGTVAAQSCFVVRTQCIKNNGSAITLGEAIVGQGQSPLIYAVYDIFPSSAGGGECILRTIIDANQNINELDESPLSNAWDRGAVVLP